MKLLLLLPLSAMLLMTGCSLLPRKGGSIKAQGVTVAGIPDAGKPATLITSEAGESVPLPAGSTVTITKTEAVPAQPATPDRPAIAAQPSVEVTKIQPSAPTVWTKTESKVNADTGTVDTTLATKRIDAEESRPLLYAALVCIAAAGLFMYIQYPTPAAACGAGAVIFFIAWKVSGLPSWFWAIGMVAVGAGVALWLGHHKGLYEPVPDQSKTGKSSATNGSSGSASA